MKKWFLLQNCRKKKVKSRKNAPTSNFFLKNQKKSRVVEISIFVSILMLTFGLTIIQKTKKEILYLNDKTLQR